MVFVGSATAAALIGAVGVGVAGFGVYESIQGQKQAAQGTQDLLANQVQQQNLQQEQNQVNATRQQRQMIREGIVARANATTNATNSGSQLGSGLEGALGQDSAQVADNVGAVGQNMAFGTAALGLKRGATQAQMTIASGTSTAAFGASMESLGGGMLKNEGAIVKVGTNVSATMQKLFS